VPLAEQGTVYTNQSNDEVGQASQLQVPGMCGLNVPYDGVLRVPTRIQQQHRQLPYKDSTTARSATLQGFNNSTVSYPTKAQQKHGQLPYKVSAAAHATTNKGSTAARTALTHMQNLEH